MNEERLRAEQLAAETRMTPEQVVAALLNLTVTQLQTVLRILQDRGGPDIGVGARLVPVTPLGSGGATVDIPTIEDVVVVAIAEASDTVDG
jgi:hypothetical protein